MKIRFQSGERGIALMMVLIVIVVFASLAGLFAYSMKVETKLARNASFDSEFEWVGRSGIELARWVLANDGLGPYGQIDSKMSKWAGGPGDTNGPLAGLDLSHYEVGPGVIALKIVDQDSKFNINVADDVILRQALTMIGVDAAEIPTIADSILDWRDFDENRHPNGAESDEYKSKDPPYFAKDAAFDDLSELLLVNGVTPAMYFGSGGGGNYRPQILNRQSARASHFDEPSYPIGMVELFTPLSGRAVNINTCTATVLQVIPEIDGALAGAIIQARAGLDGTEGTEDDTPYRSPAEVARAVPGLPPNVLGYFTRYFSVRSLVFEATVTATLAGQTRTYIAMLRRNSPRDVQVLNMYWK